MLFGGLRGDTPNLGQNSFSKRLNLEYSKIPKISIICRSPLLSSKGQGFIGPPGKFPGNCHDSNQTLIRIGGINSLPPLARVTAGNAPVPLRERKRRLLLVVVPLALVVKGE